MRGPALQSAAQIAPAVLEGDGLADRLFELLWKRDSLSDASLTLRIPDTVLYKYNAPSIWYFTAADGTIKRKTKAKVNREHIAEEFLKRDNLSGIVAYFVSKTPPEGLQEDAENQADGAEATGGARKAIIEYFDREGLRDFLFHPQKVRRDGILQRFVEPYEDRNNMIRALWSPKVCLVERRVNRLRLSDTRYDMYERAVTFEGPSFYSEIKPVRGPTLAFKAQEVADTVVQHIAACSDDRMKITRLALNFKVDTKERLWLLFASSVRLRHDQRRYSQDSIVRKVPLEVNAVLQMPDHVRHATTAWCKRPLNLQQGSHCTTCGQKAGHSDLHAVAYKVIIEYEEPWQRSLHNRRPQAVGSTPSGASGASEETEVCDTPMGTSSPSSASKEEIPPTMLRLHPRMTNEEYIRFRHDVAFLCKTTDVCEECYLKFSQRRLGADWRVWRGATGAKSEDVDEHAEADADKAKADLLRGHPLAGTQALDPSRTRRRQRATQQRIVDQQVADEAREALRLKKTQQPQVRRTKSCPRFIMHLMDGDSQPMPPPVRDFTSVAKPPLQQPLPPQFYMRPPRAESIETLERRYIKKRTKVEPMGTPYLKGLQEFASRCRDRAEMVMPSSFAKAMAAAECPANGNGTLRQPCRGKGGTFAPHVGASLARHTEPEPTLGQGHGDVIEEDHVDESDRLLAEVDALQSELEDLQEDEELQEEEEEEKAEEASIAGYRATATSSKWNFTEFSDQEERASSAATLPTTRPPSASSQATLSRNASRPWSGCSSQFGGGSTTSARPSATHALAALHRQVLP